METRWLLADCVLDRTSFSLVRGKEQIKLDPKPLALLFLLAEREGAVVSHEEALRLVWGEDVFLEGESALYTAVKKIRRALAPADLIQTVSGRGYRLKANTGDGVAEVTPRVAILPLVNLSGDPQEEYFSDGMTEELIATTAKILGTRAGVIARTSVMRYKGVCRPVQEIGRELGATHLLEGSVRRQGKRLRFAVHLLRAADETSLWAETLERDSEDVLCLQGEIASAVAVAIRAKVAGTPEGSAGIDPEVHDLYLRARHLWVQRTGTAIQAGMRYFRDSLAREPAFGPAFAGLSLCYAVLPITTGARPKECFPEAQSLAEKALLLDGSLGEAHITLGLVEFWFRRNWNGAMAHFRDAQALSPGDSAGPMFLAHVFSVLGQHERALETILEAKRLDPFSPIVGTHVGHFLYNAGRLEEALTALRSIVELAPQFWVAHLMRGKALASQGETDEALAAFATAEALNPANTEALAFRLFTLAQAGRDAEVAPLWAALESAAAPPVHRALALLGLGRAEEAVVWLEQGLAEHDVRLIFLGVETRWALLGKERYAALLRAAGLAVGV